MVTSWIAHEPVRILAIRDELVSREFDEPGRWWPDRSAVIVGGRDRLAGGTWCATDVASATTALVLNRTERHTGTPSRGVLPLAALEHGDAWAEHVRVDDMASFTLVVAGPSGVTAWTWDTSELTRADLGPGVHLATARGVDTDDAKTARYRDRFEHEDWFDLVTAETPADDRSALLVRHEFETDTFATVLGQLITAVPGRLDLRWSRTPWDTPGWVSDTTTS